MNKRVRLLVIILSAIVFTACASKPAMNSIIQPILNEFEAAGIMLEEEDVKSPTFVFSGAKEKHYSFSGGSIYVIYDFNDKEKMIEKLREVFAEAEFPYQVMEVYTDSFIVIFIANSMNLEYEEKIASIFQKLKEN